MPRGRVLLKSISQSNKMPKLKTDSARLLYTWLLAHLDINGCFYGDANTINGLVFTRLKKTEKEVENLLQDLEINNLIIRFQENGDNYLFVPDFTDKQPNLRPDHECKPLINKFIAKNITQLQPNYNQTTTFDGTSKVNISKVKESKRGEPCNGLPKDHDKEILTIPEYFNNEDFKKCFEDFKKFRKEIKKTMTERAVHLLINELSKLSNNNSDIAIQIMNQSILNNWQGVFTLKSKKKNNYEVPLITGQKQPWEDG